MVLLVHPVTADVQVITARTEDPAGTFRYLVLDGYEPVGPRAREIADRIRSGS